MKVAAELALKLVCMFCALTLWAVLPPQVYFGLLGTGFAAAYVVEQNKEKRGED